MEVNVHILDVCLVCYVCFSALDETRIKRSTRPPSWSPHYPTHLFTPAYFSVSDSLFEPSRYSYTTHLLSSPRILHNHLHNVFVHQLACLFSCLLCWAERDPRRPQRQQGWKLKLGFIPIKYQERSQQHRRSVLLNASRELSLVLLHPSQCIFQHIEDADTVHLRESIASLFSLQITDRLLCRVDTNQTNYSPIITSTAQ